MENDENPRVAYPRTIPVCLLTGEVAELRLPHALDDENFSWLMKVLNGVRPGMHPDRAISPELAERTQGEKP